MTNSVTWFDKSASNIVISDDTKFKRNFGLQRISNCRRHTGIRHWHYNISVNCNFFGKFNTNIFAHFIDTFTLNNTVWARKIDIFENTKFWTGFDKRLHRFYTIFVNHDHLAMSNIALERGADYVKSASFRSNNISITKRSN